MLLVSASTIDSTEFIMPRSSVITGGSASGFLVSPLKMLIDGPVQQAGLLCIQVYCVIESINEEGLSVLSDSYKKTVFMCALFVLIWRIHSSYIGSSSARVALILGRYCRTYNFLEDYIVLGI